MVLFKSHKLDTCLGRAESPHYSIGIVPAVSWTRVSAPNAARQEEVSGSEMPSSVTAHPNLQGNMRSQ